MPSNRKADHFRHCPHKQHGAALIVMLVIMIMGSAAFLVSSLSRIGLRLEQNQKNSQILAQAKEILISYTLSAAGAGQRPGELMYPDVLSESPITNYDGLSESGCFDRTKPAATPPHTPLISANLANMRCLGRLPWKSLGMAISNPTENDPTGFMPWYAFSRNLIDVNTPINPGLLNAWLTVRDMKGNVLSNRVAVVIILPGPPLSGQSRPPSPLGGPDQYLDRITVPAGCAAPCVPGTYNNYDLDEDFILGDEYRWIPDPNDSTRQIKDPSYQFNDRLIYITIDELMPTIVKRAAGEVRSALNGYNSAKGYFPDAAQLGTTGFPVSGNDSGLLPISTCSCASSTSCSCNFNQLASAAFKRGGSSTWSATNVSGACTRTSTQICTCTGAGYCKNSSGARNFTCNSSGNCTTNAAGTYTFAPAANYAISSALKGSSCTYFTSTVDCAGAGSFTIMEKQLSDSLANWFTDNLWHNYFYYRKSSTSSLQAGSQGSIKALVIGTGAPITSAPFASKGSAQVRPSGNINDYLDSAENTDGDSLFDATNTPLSSSYNDQVFIVAP